MSVADEGNHLAHEMEVEVETIENDEYVTGDFSNPDLSAIQDQHDHHETTEQPVDSLQI